MIKKIHEVIVKTRINHEVDPYSGHVARQVQVLSQGDTVQITHEGEKYDRDSNLTFTMPADAADYFLRQPNWFEGSSPFEAEPAVEEAPQLKKPRAGAKS